MVSVKRFIHRLQKKPPKNAVEGILIICDIFVYTAIYQSCSETCLHSLLPVDIFSVGHMFVFEWPLLSTAHRQTGQTLPRVEFVPVKKVIKNMNSLFAR